MCGSATLAMVVSSTCRSTAIITPIVTIRRSPEGSGCVATSGRLSSAIGWLLLAAVVEIDSRVDRQARDHRLGRRTLEVDPHRHALGDLHPIAVGVLRWQQRELASRSRADALYVAF